MLTFPLHETFYCRLIRTNTPPKKKNEGDEGRSLPSLFCLKLFRCGSTSAGMAACARKCRVSGCKDSRLTPGCWWSHWRSLRRTGTRYPRYAGSWRQSPTSCSCFGSDRRRRWRRWKLSPGAHDQTSPHAAVGFCMSEPFQGSLQDSVRDSSWLQPPRGFRRRGRAPLPPLARPRRQTRVRRFKKRNQEVSEEVSIKRERAAGRVGVRACVHAQQTGTQILTKTSSAAFASWGMWTILYKSVYVFASWKQAARPLLLPSDSYHLITSEKLNHRKHLKDYCIKLALLSVIYTLLGWGHRSDAFFSMLYILHVLSKNKSFIFVWLRINSKAQTDNI